MALRAGAAKAWTQFGLDGPRPWIWSPSHLRPGRAYAHVRALRYVRIGRADVHVSRWDPRFKKKRKLERSLTGPGTPSTLRSRGPGTRKCGMARRGCRFMAMGVACRDAHANRCARAAAGKCGHSARAGLCAHRAVGQQLANVIAGAARVCVLLLLVGARAAGGERGGPSGHSQR